MSTGFRSSEHQTCHPAIVQDLLEATSHRAGRCHSDASTNIYVEVWFSHHTRRPNSGMGRLVHLPAEPSTWIGALVHAWEDHIDPFIALHYHIVTPHPVGGDPEAVAHIILVQNPQPDFSSLLVTI